MVMRFGDHFTSGIKYTFKLLFQTTLAVLLYTICVLAAKLICWLEGLLSIEGYVTLLAFKALELFFLIGGAIAAIVFFLLGTWRLMGQIVRLKEK